MLYPYLRQTPPTPLPMRRGRNERRSPRRQGETRSPKNPKLDFFREKYYNKIVTNKREDGDYEFPSSDEIFMASFNK